MDKGGAKGRREYTFEIWQDGIMVVEGGGTNIDQVRSTMMHYAMMYAQDGPVQIRGPDVAALMPPDNPPMSGRRRRALTAAKDER